MEVGHGVHEVDRGRPADLAQGGLHLGAVGPEVRRDRELPAVSLLLRCGADLGEQHRPWREGRDDLLTDRRWKTVSVGRFLEPEPAPVRPLVVRMPMRRKDQAQAHGDEPEAYPASNTAYTARAPRTSTHSLPFRVLPGMAAGHQRRSKPRSRLRYGDIPVNRAPSFTRRLSVATPPS